ncbi:uncharacterized protein [Aegilops tauschii subsp. strangulata]|uniref:uncharacterized protein n=1 Tax=Aegilops tauschii subsp. strangulata TaxID=200361 RepID=UPI003CC85CF6
MNTVSELIDVESGTWKIDIVRNNFISPVAEAILNIPLRRMGGDDSWAWSAEKAGIYTVKSAYRTLIIRNEHLALEEGLVIESSETNKQMWTKLWKLNVVPKVRVFWWHVLPGILPVKSTLKYRHIASLARCKVCLSTDEDMYHALIQCTHAKRFWVEAREWLGINLPELHGLTWSRDILCDSRFDVSDQAKIIAVMWAIWTSRNNITHDKVSMEPMQSLKLIRDALAVLELPTKHACILPGHGWRPPDGEVIKVNTDAGISMLEHRAEASDVREGVVVALLRGFARVQIETDCLDVVKPLKFTPDFALYDSAVTLRY